jgi:hypothetical protein
LELYVRLGECKSIGTAGDVDKDIFIVYCREVDLNETLRAEVRPKGREGGGGTSLINLAGIIGDPNWHLMLLF